MIETSPDQSGNITEVGFAVVQKQLRRLGVSDITANVTNGFIDMAVSDGEVEPAIEVQIEERTAKSQAVSGSDADTGLRRNVFEFFPVQAIQADHLVVEVRNADTGISGIVEVGDVDTHPCARFPIGAEGDACLHRGIFEGSIALIAV